MKNIDRISIHVCFEQYDWKTDEWRVVSRGKNVVSFLDEGDEIDANLRDQLDIMFHGALGQAELQLKEIIK